VSKRLNSPYGEGSRDDCGVTGLRKLQHLRWKSYDPPLW
jgi:hypothetical protein